MKQAAVAKSYIHVRTVYLKMHSCTYILIVVFIAAEASANATEASSNATEASSQTTEALVYECAALSSKSTSQLANPAKKSATTDVVKSAAEFAITAQWVVIGVRSSDESHQGENDDELVHV